MKKTLIKLCVTSCALLACLLFIVWARYSGGERFPDLTTSPKFQLDAVEVVANLSYPPGNIAVTKDERVFFTFHPEARPVINVAELKDGQVYPYPSADMQPGGEHEFAFQEVLSVRVDRQNRLWVLDNAKHGSGVPRILAFDLSNNELVHHYDFPAEDMPLGSHANDFQVSPDGKAIYIADASIIGLQPAIVVYDVEKKQSTRFLDKHVSVLPEFYTPVVQGREMEVFGLFSIRPGVDSIALDKEGQWLYFSAVTAKHLYRVPTALLSKEADRKVLEGAVEQWADKTMSDGITMDGAGSVFITDPENSAILKLNQNGELTTLLKNERFRWPDGFSFGPDGWLYFTASALHQVIGKTPGYVKSKAPYQIFRFKPGSAGVPGH